MAYSRIKSKAQMSDCGVVYCTNCGAAICCNDTGDMPEVCPCCKLTLDWIDFEEVQNDSTCQKEDK